MTPEAVLIEGAERDAALDEAWSGYDPVLGVQSPIERRPVRWDDAGLVLHLPVTMWDDPEVSPALEWAEASGASVEAYVRASGEPWDTEAQNIFDGYRIRHDYEYWCASCVLIENAEAEKIPFVLNAPQRHTLGVRERQRTGREPIRVIQLKHRQYGSTTDYGLYGLWLQNVCLGTGNYYVISLEGGGAAKIRRRLETAAEHYPEWAGSITFRGVRNAPNSMEIAENDALVSIASVRNPQGPSGDTTRFAVISEAGKMGSTDVQSAERLMTNVMSTIRLKADTYAVMESTAEGSGAYFREQWEKAQKGESAFAPCFVSWTEDPRCTMALPADPAEWVASWLTPEADTELKAYLRLLWERGCGLRQIRWYEQKAMGYPSLDDMKQENPTTADEAFQYGGRRVFPASHVAAAYASAREPLASGVLYADGDSGRAALRGIRFEAERGGGLDIWHSPYDDYDGLLDLDGSTYTSPFVAAMDIGGTTPEADWTVVTVLDRRPTAHDLPPVIAAEWRVHLDHDLAAWQAARLAAWYNALLAVEVNSLLSDKGDPEGGGMEEDNGRFILDLIAPVYTQIYRRRNAGKKNSGRTSDLGWHTNVASKPRAMGYLKAALRMASEGVPFSEGEDRNVLWSYEERSHGAAAELDTYIQTEKGVLKAAPKKKDDRVMTRAIALAVHHEMTPCARVPKRAPQDYNTSRTLV